jgi:hypothetical protein
MDWVNAVLCAHAVGRWVLVFDVDELFVYPNCETVDLRRFIGCLEARGEDALPALMVDMYSKVPVHEAVYTQGQAFLDVCPYFDADDLRAGTGGPRERLFYGGADAGQPPLLRKVPLVRWRAELAYRRATHRLEGVRASEARGALLHFKLFHDFADKVRDGVQRKQYWKGSVEYQAYLRGIEASPELRPFNAHSRRYEHSSQLVRLGIMEPLPDYSPWTRVRWVYKRCRRALRRAARFVLRR